MNEKTYKAMKGAGIGNIVLGVIVLATGIACGILALINGARLIRHKSDIIF